MPIYNQCQKCRATGVFVSDFPRSPFSVLIHIVLVRTPLSSATLRRDLIINNKINFSVVNRWMEVKKRSSPMIFGLVCRSAPCCEDTIWILEVHIDLLRSQKKKKMQVILSALCPLLCNSTRPQHTLQMFADHCGPRQTIPWETINQGLLQPQGELYPFQTIFNHRSPDQLLEFRTNFYETISSEFLVQGNFKHTQFSWEHWNWRDSNTQSLAPKRVPYRLS